MFGVAGDLPPIHAFDPFGGVTQPVFAWKVEVDFSSVFFVARWGLLKWPLRVDALCRDARSLKVVKGLLEKPLFDSVSAIRPSGSFSHCVDDAVEHHGMQVLSLKDVSCRPGRHGTPSDFAPKAEL